MTSYSDYYKAGWTDALFDKPPAPKIAFSGPQFYLAYLDGYLAYLDFQDMCRK